MTQTTLTTTPETTRCPRCSGHLYRDQYGDLSCWNCGWIESPPPLPLMEQGGSRPGSGRPAQEGLTQDQANLVAYIRRLPGLTAGQLAAHRETTHHAMKGRLHTLAAKGHVRNEGRGGLGDPQRWYAVEEEAS